MQWYTNSANIAALGRWLQAEGRLPDSEIWYFVSKPWKWETEWREYAKLHLAKAVP